MKLHILSDLHLGVQGMARPLVQADVVILAGDISRPRAAVDWALGFCKPVLYVPGNHEFYGGNLTDTVRELQQVCRNTSIHVLDDQCLVIDGVRFLGSTLWTDFRAAGDGERRLEAMAEAQQLMRDFSRIRIGEPPADTTLTPEHTTELFATHVRWLQTELARPFAGPTVVITHHAPSPKSVHPRFAGSALNACFVSDAEHLLDARRVQLWIHGHTHDSFDYQLNGTRVVCNPRGYARDGVNENPNFDPELTLEVV